MNNKLKFKQKLILSIVGTILTLAALAPLIIVTYLELIVKPLQIPNVDINLLVTGLFIFFITITTTLIYHKWLKKIWQRKLQALSTASTLGIIPSTSIILNKLLQSLEYLPHIILTYSISLLLTSLNKSLQPLTTITFTLLITTIILTIISTIITYIKHNYINNNIIINNYNNQTKTNKHILKQLNKKTKKSKQNTLMKEQIKQLEKQLLEEED